VTSGDRGSASELAEARGNRCALGQRAGALRKQLEGERFVEDRRNALALAATAGTIGSPLTHARLLEMMSRPRPSYLGPVGCAALFLLYDG
jgi:hypothetical protein